MSLEKETVWLNQSQLVSLFEKDKRTVSEHINNIFKERELSKSSTVRKFQTVQIEGGRSVSRNLTYYNLDVIISVGYRVKSKRGTQFRIWANQRLKDYLIKGYVINKKRLAETEKEIKFLRSGIQIVSRAIEEKANEKEFQWLRQFSKGLTLLDDYDHENLDDKGLTQRTTVYPTKLEYETLIDQMKKKIDSDVFGLKKDQSFESAISQISKGFGKMDFYRSLEEKAAMLLYLIVKNHAFTDGNKRIAAASFLMFLQKNNILNDELGTPIIGNEALASLTLFVAASKANEMETVKRLIVSILNRSKNQKDNSLKQN